ncbi:MAG: T9SS type A sorting domain-containing protein, partial [Saprospiraceae bacterium]
FVRYDVKIYPFNGDEFIQIKPTTTVSVDTATNTAELCFDTRQSTIQSIRLNGIPYNNQFCGDYHRILWSVEDGCGNWSTCEYLFRLEDCKQPSPVCINGLSTVVMPVGGEVTVWAIDFDASSFDECTPSDELLFSFSGDSYQPSFTYDCDNVPAFGVEISVQIWVADGGTDDNCNGQISWNERNTDFCTTTIVITDNNDICGDTTVSVVGGEIHTVLTESVEKVAVLLTTPGHLFPAYLTAKNGLYEFNHVPHGLDYTISPERNDEHRNGVSTLDLVRIQKHLLGKEIFTSPYQYIAADANNNQQVSAIDLVEIRKLILGIYTEYPNNKSWRFVEKGYDMNPDHPWPFNESIILSALTQDSMMHNDFVAVKIGDVNNTAQANASQILPRNGRRMLEIGADVQGNLESGEDIEVILSIPELLSGFQWTLETSGLEYMGVSSDDILIDNSHTAVHQNGIITMSWNSVADHESAIAKGEQIIKLAFKVTEGGKLMEMLNISGRITAAEAYTLDGEILDVELTGHKASAEFALYQNKPNPWNTTTTIGFDLPQDADARLTIFDAVGKIVSVMEMNGKAGYNVFTVKASDLPATGVMYYKLESGEYSASKKMLLLQ